MTGWLLALVVLHGADCATTAYAQTHLTGRELNPAMRVPPAALCGIQAGVATGEVLALKALEHRGHPKLAKGLTVSIVNGKGFVVGWNIQQIRKAGR